MIQITVENLAGGGLVERIHEEIERVVANICDPNTPSTKARKVKMEMVIKPDEDRSMGSVTVQVSSVLAPPKPIVTAIRLGADPITGEVGASELTSGENPNQARLPEVDKNASGKITKFAGNGGNQ